MGEQSTSLSPEPWANPQPEMWQPPPTRRRNSTLPYFITALGVMLLAAIALGIVFWPDNNKASNSGPQQSTAASVQEEQSPTNDNSGSSSPTEESNPDAKQQATQVDALLSDMMSTRTELGSVVSAGCATSALQRIRSRREEQLRTAQALEVSALDSGTELKDALTKALRISIESNQLYLDNAPGCPSDADADDVNTRANQAKAEVVQYWNPIATQQGLATRDSGSI